MQRASCQRSRLPLQPTPLFGRAETVRAVEQQLLQDEVRLLTITGLGGVGKTRLALAVAEGLRTAFADGTQFVDLAPLADVGLVMATISQALGVRDTGAVARLESLIAHVQDRQVLLVLDNYEHVLASATTLSHLLEACPRLKFLVTSREPLRLRWEHIFPLQPLNLPDLAHLPDLTELAAIPSIALFVTRAQAVQPTFVLTAENAATIAAICTRLDGLPLALELAASRISVLPPQALLARLERRLPLLSWSTPDLPARQQTLRATIDWSYDLLSREEQTLFRRLAVFSGGWSLAAAEAVTTFDTLAYSTVTLDALSTLVDKGLIIVCGDGEDAPRFRMLETIREYAGERLEASNEAETMRQRHMHWYRQLAEQAVPHWSGPQQRNWLLRLEQEGDNLRAALRWTVERGKVECEARLCAALWQMWIRGYLSEGRAWMQGVLSRIPQVPPMLRSHVLNGAASIALSQGDYEQAKAHYGEALALRRSTGDTNGATYALHNLGMVAMEQGDLAQAALLLEESVAGFRKFRNLHGTAFALNNLGRVTMYMDKDEQATDLQQEALLLWRTLGNSQGVAETLSELGRIAYRAKRYHDAASLYQESLVLLYQLGNERRLMAACIEGWAEVQVAQGQYRQAVRLLGGAEVLRARIGAPVARVDRSGYESMLATLREQLDPEELATAWAQGRATILQEIIAEAQPQQPSEQLSTLAEAQQHELATHTAGEMLSPREYEVLQLVAAGLSNKEIGERLFITVHTAKYHVTSILNKLGADTRAQAVAHAMQRGLL